MLGNHKATLPIPDMIQQIIGWRAWNVKVDEHGQPLLASPDQEVLWQPGRPLEAEYWLAEGHRLREHCGINAYDARERIETSPYVARCGVWGAVSLWGEVRQYEEGYRAQWAYPAELFVSEGSREALYATQLAERYQVPCTVVAEPEIKTRVGTAAKVLQQINERIADGDYEAGELVFDHEAGVDPALLPTHTIASVHPVIVRSPLHVGGRAYVAVEKGFVLAHGHAHVHLQILCTQVHARDHARVTGRMNVQGHFTLKDHATAQLDGANGVAHDHSELTVYSKGHVTVRDQATVHAYGTTCVYAYDKATVHAHDQATVHVYGPDVEVHAAGDAAVHRHYQDPKAHGRRGNSGLPPQWQAETAEDGTCVLYMPVLVTQSRFRKPGGEPGFNTSVTTPAEALEQAVGKASSGSYILHETARRAAWSHSHPDDAVVAMRVSAGDLRWGLHGGRPSEQVSARTGTFIGYVDLDGQLLSPPV